MNYPLIGLAEIITLFLLSRVLTRTLSQLIHSVTGSTRSIVYSIAFLFFPGTLLHELAHFFMAKILFVPTGKMSLLPHLEEDSLKLGSVEIAKTDPLRKLLIGVAPFIVGVTILFALYYFLSLHQEYLYSWNILLALLITFEITNTMFSSKKDMEGTLALFVVLGIGTTLCFFLGVTLPLVVNQNITTLLMSPFFTILATYLSIPIGINLVLLFLGKLLLKRF